MKPLEKSVPVNKFHIEWNNHLQFDGDKVTCPMRTVSWCIDTDKEVIAGFEVRVSKKGDYLKE
jgi:hypothetical protein